MKYIKVKVNKILLVILLCLCLGCEKKSVLPQNNAINNELNDINIHALHTEGNDNNFLITINIENKKQHIFYIFYCYISIYSKHLF